MTGILIESGRILVAGEFHEAAVDISGGVIARLDGPARRHALRIDATDLLVLPGIIDLHGDAFERQLMPRAGVDFPADIALADSDRQAVANGITTVFHGTTWSWEPGLRSAANAQRLLEAIEAMRPQLAADTRFHLRHETFNVDAEDTIKQWLAEKRIDLLAFNDHMHDTAAGSQTPRKRARMLERCGIGGEAFDRLVESVMARAGEVPASVGRLAQAARRADVAMLSHDDKTPEMRRTYRAMGVSIAEFPVNEDTAREAATNGDFIVFGAPNVVRGGSHTGWTKASDMIATGLCSILASDYYYPAQLLAAFRLVADGILPLPQAWALISSAPAKAAGLADRGIIAEGLRADIVLVDASVALRPRVVAVVAKGRLVHLADGTRVQSSMDVPAASLAAE